MHVALALGGVDGVEALPFVQHAERADGERLRLAALEQARAVHAGQVARHDVQRADVLGTTAVGALARLDDHRAHGLLLELLELGGDVALPCGALLIGELLLLDAGLELFHLAHARKLVGIAQRGGHLGHERRDALGDGRVGDVDGPLDRLDVRTVEEALLGFAERGDGLLAERHGGQHVLFGDLVGAGLHHGDVVGRAGDGQLEIRVLGFLERGVHDELARLHVAADAHASGGAVEGSRAQHEGSAGAHDADGVGRVDAVDDERRAHDVHLALEAVGEAGTDGTVHHAGRQRALVGRTRLALEVASRDAADRVHLLDEVDREGEEVVVLLLLRDDGRNEHRRVALRDDDRAGRLLGELACLQTVLLPVQFEGFDDFFHMLLSFSSPERP